MSEIEAVYRETTAYVRKEGYEVGSRLWSDGFGLVAAGADLAGKPHVIVSVTSPDTTIMVSKDTLIEALRLARHHVLTSNHLVPLDAARWLTTIIDQWETDHPGDKPN